MAGTDPRQELSSILAAFSSAPEAAPGNSPTATPGAAPCTYAAGCTALAEIIGLARPYMAAWMKKPDFPLPTPAGYNVEEVRRFIETHRGNDGRHAPDDDDRTGASKTRSSARARKEEAQAKLAELKAAQLEGTLVDAQQVAEYRSREIEMIKQHFFRGIVELPPRLIAAGDNIETMQHILRAYFDDVLKKGFELVSHDWMTHTAAPGNEPAKPKRKPGRPRKTPEP